MRLFLHGGGELPSELVEGRSGAGEVDGLAVGDDDDPGVVLPRSRREHPLARRVRDHGVALAGPRAGLKVDPAVTGAYSKVNIIIVGLVLLPFSLFRKNHRALNHTLRKT